MKRRHGSKKGRPKKPKLVNTNEVASNAVSLNTEDNSGLDDFDNEDIDSGMDAETETETETTPSPPEITQPETVAKADTVGKPSNNIFGKAVYTRVKVKIKTKNLESQLTTSEVPSQSDTDKSSQQVGSEKQGVPSEKMEDSANSLSETNGGISGNASQKSVGIKIKSSRGLGSSSMSPCSNTEPNKGDRTDKKDSQSLHQESRYNEQELRTALEVIRKVMKMEAAEPFNVPVNPVALGIPDYFDVIETPMDFGTICNNLEKGVKYKNSEDVYKDVKYIWENCYKYNNKGDYIVELMKRVKKGFAKYWAAVGLYDQPQESSGTGLESNPVKVHTPSSEGTPVNGGAMSLSSKKFHGLKKHKEGCQCAICVMMRRRQEREEIARMMGGHLSDDSMGDDIKAEGFSRGESPFGEYASSNLENSPEADAEKDRKGPEAKLGHIRDFYGRQNEDETRDGGKREGSQDLQSSHRSGDENATHYHASAISLSNETRKELHKQNDDAAIERRKRPKELLDKKQRAKMLENLRYLENPMLLELCGTLFTDNSESFWSGPHSLVGKNRGSRHHHRHSFHSTISSFMK